MKTLIKTLFFFQVMMSLLMGAQAQSDTARRKEFNLERSELAIQGYDPVSYLTTGKAIEGKKDITMAYQGIVYRFASTHNRDLFKVNPAKYEPQFGGWCAYAMGKTGEKVEIDPETFKVIDGKLYLFYNKFFNNTLDSWNKDEAHLKPNADKNWSMVIQQNK